MCICMYYGIYSLSEGCTSPSNAVLCLPHTSTPELVTEVAQVLGLSHEMLVLFSTDQKWMATPWEGIRAQDDIVQLYSQEEVS